MFRSQKYRRWVAVFQQLGTMLLMQRSFPGHVCIVLFCGGLPIGPGKPIRDPAVPSDAEMFQVDPLIDLPDSEIRLVLPIAIRDRFHFIGVLVFIGHIIEEQEVGDPAFLDALHHFHSVGEFPVTVDPLCFVGFEVLVLQVLDVFPLVLKSNWDLTGFTIHDYILSELMKGFGFYALDIDPHGEGIFLQHYKKAIRRIVVT